MLACFLHICSPLEIRLDLFLWLNFQSMHDVRFTLLHDDDTCTKSNTEEQAFLYVV